MAQNNFLRSIKRTGISILALMLFRLTLTAQTKLPVIHARSKVVSIRDGAFLDKDSWKLNPNLHPDNYTADRTRETKFVTFYTDVDSLRVKIKPGSHFDFIILLNGKDSCYTRIQSAIPPGPNIRTKTDTIPFRLTDNSAIAIQTILNGHDSVWMHLDLSAFGIRLMKNTIRQRNIQLNQVRSLQMGTITLTHPAVRATDLTAKGMDGRLGWDLFEGQTVEINYDRHLILVRPALPRSLKGYHRIPMRFIRSYPSIRAVLVAAGKHYTGDFLLDNGSGENLIIDSTWSAAIRFPSDLKVLSTITLHDPRGVNYESRKVEIPAVRLKGFVTTNVSALLLGSQHPTGFPVNFLGNGLLRYFDLIIDFRHDRLYLKPVESGLRRPV